MDASRSRRQILILDCCHSGAFAHGGKAATERSVGTATAFKGDGTGRVILTATDSTQHAWEGDELIRGDGRYWISKTPITNAQYAPFVQTGKVEPPKHWQGDKPPKERLEHPVVYVSWEDSIAYCDRLGERLKLDVTLPSEAEWEKAAGWDAQKGQKLIYPWGNKYRKGYCNDSNGKVGGTSPVTQFAQGASPYGLLDMAGNVSEWTRSHWAPSAKLGVAFFRPDYKYPYDVSDGRENLSDRKAWRVLRGGSFNYGPGFQRVSYRLRHNIDLCLGYLGFRVVVRPPSQ